MYTVTSQGIADKVMLIKPEKLTRMDENDIVVVNRVRLNSKLVECSIKNINTDETSLIRKALQNMILQERQIRRTIMGAEMRVGDIIKIFPDYENFPQNSFAVATNCKRLKKSKVSFTKKIRATPES